MHSKAPVNRPDSYPKGNFAPNPPRRPRFPNIKDLQDQAAALDVDETTPVCGEAPPQTVYVISNINYSSIFS